MDEGISLAELVDVSPDGEIHSFPIKSREVKKRKCDRCMQEKNLKLFFLGRKKIRNLFKIFRKLNRNNPNAANNSLFCECGNSGPLPIDQRERKIKNPVSVNLPLYHGSPINNLKQIEPKDNFLKAFQHPKKDSIPPLVFLTPDIHVARQYADRWHEAKALVHRLLHHKVPNRNGSVYRVKTKNKQFAKILHPGGEIIYVSTDRIRVKRELRPNQDEPPLFTYGLSRMLLLLCTGALAYVFFWGWGITFSV